MVLGSVTGKASWGEGAVKAQWSAVVVVLAILQSSSALHLHLQTAQQEPNVYNKNLYLQQLESIQNRYKGDLQAIRAKFVQINLGLNATNASSSSQVIALQETLAEERDALYNIQQYLALPFALKSCECLNFTPEQRQDLQAQVGEVSKEIRALKQKLGQDEEGKPFQDPECPGGNCAVVKEIRSEIEQLQSYARIMAATASSECCSKITYLFRDDLAEDSSWLYGSLTEKQYRESLAKRSKMGKMASCPKSLPFVDQKLNECFACPKDQPLFDLGKRQCTAACEQQNLTLDTIAHKCDYNRTCPVGLFFSNTTLACVKDLGTSSRCPQSRPVWHEETLSCQECAKAHPFYDINVRSCRFCTENQIYDLYTRTCYSKAHYHPVTCPNGFHYNTKTRGCESEDGAIITPEKHKDNATAPGQPASGTSALCPPATPFWDSQDFVCTKCPSNTPLFNDSTSKCEACAKRTKWNYVSKACVEASHNCSADQLWNKQTQHCETIKTCGASEAYNGKTGRCEPEGPGASGNIGICPPTTPFWNDASLSCQHCPLNTPLWNDSTQQCQACPEGSAYDLTTKGCRNKISCPAGTFYSSKDSKCQSIDCPHDKPVFNAVTSVCEDCAKDSFFNYETKACEANGKLGKSSVCPKETPYWSNQRLACERCPSAQKWSESSKKCEATGGL